METKQDIFDRFNSRSVARGDCLIHKSNAGNGYAYFTIRKNEKEILGIDRTWFSAHRFSWFINYGYLPPRHILVCHKCDVRSCVRIEHLFLGTSKDNAVDMAKKGRSGQAKLSTKDVVYIKNSNESDISLAFKFNVHQNHIHGIRIGKYWSYIQKGAI